MVAPLSDNSADFSAGVQTRFLQLRTLHAQPRGEANRKSFGYLPPRKHAEDHHRERKAMPRYADDRFGKSEDRLTVAVAPCFSYPCEMPVRIDIFHPHREAFPYARAHVRLPLTITSIHEFVGGETERTSLDSAPAPWHGLKTRLQITKEKPGRSTTRPTGMLPSTQEGKFMLPHNELTPQTKSSKNGWIRYLRVKKGNTTS